MTTEPTQAHLEIQGSIDFLTNPALAGLPPEFLGMGVLRASEDDGRKSTFLVERDYALLLLESQRLGGIVNLTPGAVRWARLGWPEEWGTDAVHNPSWAKINPGTTT